jgi:hypothetical protein
MIGPLGLSGFPAFTGSTCCATQTVTLFFPVELKAGQQYWVAFPYTMKIAMLLDAEFDQRDWQH